MFTEPRVQLDAYLAYLSAIPPWTLQRVDERGCVVDHFRFDNANLMDRAVLARGRLAYDVDVVAGEVLFYGRLAAQAKLVWQVREREYRVWKAQRATELRASHRAGGEKQPSKELIEESYRVHPEYGEVNFRIERAQEVYNAQEAVYQAFRAKYEVLKADVRRAPDGTINRLSQG